MKANHLHDLWSSPDNTRLTPRQFSFRLPTHIAAKIAALCDMYPTKNRTQIVADLLTAALADLERNLPVSLGPLTEDQHIERLAAEQNGYEYEPVHLANGPRSDFRRLANQHFKEIEKELGNENPEQLYPPLLLSPSELQSK
jgi:hypothetical protein